MQGVWSRSSIKAHYRSERSFQLPYLMSPLKVVAGRTPVCSSAALTVVFVFHFFLAVDPHSWCSSLAAAARSVSKRCKPLLIHLNAVTKQTKKICLDRTHDTQKWPEDFVWAKARVYTSTEDDLTGRYWAGGTLSVSKRIWWDVVIQHESWCDVSLIQQLHARY